MSKKYIFITGGASGMGKSTVQLFIDKGWFVGCYDINKDNLNALEEEINSENLICRELDVANKDMFENAVKEFSNISNNRLDILFNNAGIAEGGFFELQPYENHLRAVSYTHLTLPTKA